MRVLVACEFSEILKYAFMRAGHDAYSCDLLRGEQGGLRHIVGNVLNVLHEGWDLMVAFPPCTHLAVSGARWFKDKGFEQDMAVGFVKDLMDAPIKRIAIENPIGVLSTRIRKPDQIIQPWQFWDGEPGKGEVKATCLWLKNLPKLVPTTPNETGRIPRIWKMGPSPNRGRERSRTYQGIANAMAEQWGSL